MSFKSCFLGSKCEFRITRNLKPGPEGEQGNILYVKVSQFQKGHKRYNYTHEAYTLLLLNHETV